MIGDFQNDFMQGYVQVSPPETPVVDDAEESSAETGGQPHTSGERSHIRGVSEPFDPGVISIVPG